VLRMLWTEPLVNFRGAHHVISNAGLNPLPIQRPIPIWFGGSAEPALRRAARLADGWMPSGRKPDDAAKTLVTQLEKYLQEAGRDRRNFGIDPWISIAGLPKDEWHKRVEAWQRLGATHIAVDTMRAGFATPQAHMDAIRSFRDVIYPAG
jgi:alkanesulfonate monooxygenase SsuD/methylene tetrahydromethanopterin reductase-like flavin-dependent oxidoreductase (luciferase family)